MWPQRLRSRGGSDSPSASPSASPRLNPSLSFRDLRFLVDDDDVTTAAAAGDNRHHEIPIRTKLSVFHRVRAATAALRTWKSLSLSTPACADTRIVLYYTSLRVVRKTFEDCRAVRSILRGFGVAVDERDLSMDSTFLSELKQILGKKQLSLPRVFVDGRYIGGFDEIQKLHESGELKKFVEGAPAARAGVCSGCGGTRFLLCDSCNGSHKFFSEKSRGFRSCSGCNENGLVKCPDCYSVY